MNDPILHIENLAIGRKEVLFENISTSIQESGLVILSGPNGIGKSTLLKTITGLIPAKKGQIHILGKLVRTDDRVNLAKMIAYVGTERVRDEYISVLELVRYGQFPYLRSGTHDDFEKSLDEAMEMLGLNMISGKFLNSISDGEWQKANIARALVQNTPVIAMDEPSAFLDYPSKIKLFKDLAQIARKKSKLIICSTHDMELANKFGTIFWHIDYSGFKSAKEPHRWE